MRNNGFPPREVVARLKEQYPRGTRVELVYMNDPYTKLPEGAKGSVIFVDDAGSVHINWDCGSSLGAVYGKDIIRMASDSFVTDKLFDQILTIRESGKVNMFDVPGVQQEANEREFYELVVFLEEHRKKYAEFILTGRR